MDLFDLCVFFFPLCVCVMVRWWGVDDSHGHWILIQPPHPEASYPRPRLPLLFSPPPPPPQRRRRRRRDAPTASNWVRHRSGGGRQSRSHFLTSAFRNHSGIVTKKNKNKKGLIPLDSIFVSLSIRFKCPHPNRNHLIWKKIHYCYQ